MSAVTLITLPERVETCRKRLEEDPLDAQVVGELRQAIATAGENRATESLHRTCDVLDSSTADSHMPRARNPLTKTEHERLVVHPREKQERRHKLASVLGRVLHLLQGDETARTVARVTELATQAAYPQLEAANTACAAILGIHPQAVHIARGTDRLFTPMMDKRPFVCAHYDFVNDSERKLTEGQLWFAIAHQLEHIKNGHTALLQISPERLEALMLDQVPFIFRTPIQLASKAIGFSRANLAAKKIGDWLPDNSRTAKVFDTVGELLPDKDQETILPEVVHDWVRGWIQAVEYSADRAGLLACGNVQSAALGIIALSPELSAAKVTTIRNELQESGMIDRAAADRLRELLRFAYSREYLSAA